jgi:hypothetical protein
MAEPLPLNKFRLITASLQTGNNTIYREDLDVASIILSTQITNLTNTTHQVSVKIQKGLGGGYTNLVHSGSIPPGESFNPLAGKIVLERNDGLIVYTPAAAGSLDLILSILENANS